MLEKSFGPGHPGVAETLRNLAASSTRWETRKKRKSSQKIAGRRHERQLNREERQKAPLQEGNGISEHARRSRWRRSGDGYVVIENAVPHEPLDILREKMDQDSRVLIDRELWGGAGGLKGHLQQGPPPFAPFVFREIVANPFVIQVNTALLGEGIFNSFYNGNTNCPGSGTQPLHRDGPHLWPGHEPAHPTACQYLSARCDGRERGSSCPGTQHTFPETVINKETEEAQRKVSPPVSGCAKKGSVLIRDVRLWHRGVPNRSDHMIALVQCISWYRNRGPLMFNTGCEKAFPDDCGLNHNAEFIEDPIDYQSAREQKEEDEGVRVTPSRILHRAVQASALCS